MLLRSLAIGLAILLCGCSSKPADSEKQPASAVPSAPPKPAVDFGAIEVTPASGSGMDASFRVNIKPASQKPALVGLLINDRQNGEAACYAFRNLTNGDNSLVADSGAGALVMGDKKSIGNKQCEILREGTTSTDDAAGIAVTFHIRFRPAFHGAKHVWVAPTDPAGAGPELKQVGDWTVQ